MHKLIDTTFCTTFEYCKNSCSLFLHLSSEMLIWDCEFSGKKHVLNLSLCACIKHSTSQSRQTSVTCQNTELWSSGPVNKLTGEWLAARIEIQDVSISSDSSYKLILEGTIPAGYPDARICVDNITSYTEPCSALEKASAPLPSQWSWAQYFGLTFVGALILGLIIPVLFLVILIWACRRRHHTMHSNYTNSKLFSTNLWYYIGGKEICDDPNGFRGSSSLLRSKQFNSPSATGTLLNGGGGHHMMSNADVMDLPDVVVPGGRVVAFNYSGNTLGSNTLRHNHNNAGYTNTNYLPSSQNGQVMLANVNGTAPLSGSGVNVSTVARTCQNPMPLVSNELIQQQPRNQQQNENYTYQTNTAFGESTSVGLMAANQSPMLMTQSMAPNYGSDTNHPAQSNVSSTNAQQMNRFNTNAQVYNKPQQQPRAQSQYFPPIQHPQSNIVQQPQQQTVQPIQQPQLQQPPSFQNQLQPQQQPQQQQLLSNQSYISNQFNPQQQHQSIQQQIQQQFPLPPPPATCQQLNPPHPTHLQQTQHQNQPAAPFVQQPVNQHPIQSQQTQQQQQPIVADQRGQQVVNGQIHTSSAPVHLVTSQQSYQAQVQNCQSLQQQCNTNTSNPGNNNNINMNNGQALVAPTNRCLSMSPNSIGTDSLTEADQQAAMALLAAATEGMDTFRENQATPNSLQSPVPITNNINSESCLNNNTNNNNNSSNNMNNNNCLNNNNNTQVPVDEDNPPPGYDEAIGLIQNNFMNNNVNVSMMMMNTMVKPAVPIPNTTYTPPPALPPRRIINGVGLEDIEDPQSMAYLSLAERYGLPVAEI